MATQTTAQPFSAGERRDLLQTIAATKREIKRLNALYNDAGNDKPDDVQMSLTEAGQRYRELIESYEAGLPRPALSRCPFTGGTVKIAIDTIGIDGPWWDYEMAARPPEQGLPTVFAFSGAMGIRSRPPKTPFLCKPGPGAPFVIPRLLVDPRIKAVISTVKIRNTTAWPVFYFAEETPFDLVRINDWGRDYYVAENAYGEGYCMKTYDLSIDYDFDLEFYIRSGRLLWIEPGDEDLRLNSTVSPCPYLGLKGRQYPVALYNGELWNSLLDQESVDEDQPTV